MTAIIGEAVYAFAVKFALIFLIAPLCIILLGYLVFIAVQSVRELDQIDEQERGGGKEE